MANFADQTNWYFSCGNIIVRVAPFKAQLFWGIRLQTVSVTKWSVQKRTRNCDGFIAGVGFSSGRADGSIGSIVEHEYIYPDKINGYGAVARHIKSNPTKLRVPTWRFRGTGLLNFVSCEVRIFSWSVNYSLWSRFIGLSVSFGEGAVNAAIRSSHRETYGRFSH